MAVTRRRMFEALAMSAAGAAAQTTESEVSIEALRHASSIHGAALTDERLRVIKPVIERRIKQLQALREFEIDDSIEPAHGIEAD